MIPFLVSILAPSSAFPKIGIKGERDDYFVIEGGKRRPATFWEKRRLQADEGPSNHPTGKYRLEAASLHTDDGGLKGFKVVDAGGRVVAGLTSIFGSEMGIGNNEFSVLGWGRGADDIVVQCESGSPASGTHYRIESRNLLAKRRNPRIELGCAGGNALVIGRKAVLEPEWYKGHGDHPELFWRRSGASPKSLRFGGHTVHVFGIKQSRDRRWALVEDMGQGSKPGQLNDPARWGDDPGQWLLVDTSRGNVKAVTPMAHDYGAPWWSEVRFL